MLDFMMWVTVLGSLIIGGLLAWALAGAIKYVFLVRIADAACSSGDSATTTLSPSPRHRRA